MKRNKAQHNKMGCACTKCNEAWGSDAVPKKFSVQSRTYQNFRSWHVYLTKLLVQAYWNKILVFWTRSYYLYHSNKVCFCLEYQAQRIQSWEEGMIWNDWDICLRFSCSLLYMDGLKESSGKLSLNILLHFCLWLRIIMPLTGNPQATHEQSYIAVITKLTNTKKNKNQQDCLDQYEQPAFHFWDKQALTASCLHFKANRGVLHFQRIKWENSPVFKH